MAITFRCRRIGDTVMKKKIVYFIVVFFLPMLFLTCADNTTEDKQVLAKINEYELTLGRFEEQLVEELEFDEDFKLTREAREELLEQMIREELLIQEAVKQKLDRRKEFIKSIEHHWKATLIRDLMNKVGESLGKNTYATEEEIEARYKNMTERDKAYLPMKDLKEIVAMDIKEEKKRKKFDEWMNKLNETASIEINKELLGKK
jgi:SurA-like N-terminal domain